MGSPLWENRDQHSENPEKNKFQYPNCILVTQDLCTPLYSNKKNNYRVICQIPCTVKHFPKECGTFNFIRKCFFNANSMKDQFEMGGGLMV